MQKLPLNIKTAALLALGISLLMNILFVVMFLYGRDAVMQHDGEHIRREFQPGSTLGHFTSNFLIAFLLYIVNFRILNIKAKLRFKWLWAIVMTIICATILSYIMSWIQLEFLDARLVRSQLIKGSLFRDYSISIVVMLSSQLLYLTYKNQQAALENERLKAENMKTRFTALKNQVDPHFLFNSLNTLNSLIKTDNDKAQEYVQELSSVFRYTLQNKETMKLGEELKFTQAYCHLMQIRYGDSLQFIYRIDDYYCNYSVIPLSLQTLVENAIKHNVVSTLQPLSITIETLEDKSVRVSNHIQPKKEPESGERIGLANLEERYRLMWQKEVRISSENNVFGVIIPLIDLQ